MCRAARQPPNQLNQFARAAGAGGIGGTNVVGNFELTNLAGTNTSRLIEVVIRFNW